MKLTNRLKVEDSMVRKPSKTESGFDESPNLSRKGSSSDSDVFYFNDIFDPLDQSVSKESGFGSPLTASRKSKALDSDKD